MAKSMALNSANGLSSLLKDGHKHMEGIDQAVGRNIDAVKQLADITRTSLGPNGMNKLVINHLEKISVTSDTAVIVQELEVVHPAAKMVVMAAKMQENEYGDGTNLVVSFAGELLSNSADLLRMGLHTSEIVTGYQKATAKTLEILEELVVHTVEDVRNLEQLIFAVKPVLSSKQYGYEDVLAPLVAEACMTVIPPAPKKPKINVDNIRVCKIMGGNIYDSEVLKGMVVQRDTEGTVTEVKEGKVAVFGCGIEASSTEAKGTVMMKSADELLNYNKGEERRMEEAIQGIAESGAKVIVAGGSVSEMAMHFIEKYRLMIVKITSKWELRRLCRAVGASALVRLGAPTPDEMGYCDLVYVREIGGRKITIFRQEDEDAALATIVLRASTNNVLNDLERAIDDGVSCAKATLNDNRFVAGAGACEIELARRIQDFGESTPGLDQYAIKKYGQALEIVARTLSENVGRMGTDVISSLYAAHANGEKNVGVNVDELDEKLVVDQVERGIVDHAATKMSSIRLGSDAAVTVLRVDQIIMSKAAGGPKPRT